MTSSAQLSDLIFSAKRPIFIWGAGIRPYAKDARHIAEQLGIPVACTWGAIDLLPSDHPLMAGGFGTHGTRAANFAVQNADLVISIGSRLDTKATGHPPHFARGARIVMVDIDQAEIDKFVHLGRKIDLGICEDAGVFLQYLKAPPLKGDWPARIRAWRKAYDMPPVTWPGINPYQFVKDLAKYTDAETILCSDTGCALGWMMQGFPFKGERFIHDFNMTAMGYCLPAAVGASFASGKRVIAVVGDGSIMMSLPELATIFRHDLNIKIVLFNNQGHAMCRQTQRQWLGSNYVATSVEGGLGFPDWGKTASAFGIYRYYRLEDMFQHNSAGFYVANIHPDAQLIPQAKYGQPLEDQEPLLPWEELCANMLVSPLPRS